MPFGLQWIVDKITFPSPPSSYSLTSHPEIFFVKSPKSRPHHPGVPCMLYTIPQGAPILLVHAHSNGCDIGDMRQTLQSISESLRVHVMSFEFPGYGLHVGAANMKSIDEAASAVLNFIVQDLRVNISQVVWYGRSIGSGPAIRIVHKISKELNQQPGGVVLQCGYANFPEVAGHLFGRVAKQLVSPLWPNEAMLRDLHCPVLLIHGRNDTMIPIEQSEKLWRAVSMKELSHFHTCDCGHNDFNFRRCTLRPIYDFLFGLISAPSFPATNFSIDVAASSRAYVHHIGPLRARIPVYGFRRAELEEWMRRLQQQGSERVIPTDSTGAALVCGQQVVLHGMSDSPELNGKQAVLADYVEHERSWTVQLASGERLLLKRGNLQAAEPAAGIGLATGERVMVVGLQGTPRGAAANGKEGLLVEFDQREKKWGLRLDGSSDAVLLGAENLQVVPMPKTPRGASQGRLEAKGREVQLPAGQQSASSPAPAKKGKDKSNVEPPPIPDFTELPPIEDVSQALLDAEGMVRTCTLRVDAFLERLQRQFDRIEGLESKPLDEVIEFVEAEFWACDPLLCLWEEVSLPQGERVRFRLGPFSVDSAGATSYDPALGAGGGTGPSPAEPGLLRIPTWIFQPSPAHFRCLAEWSLLHSERLQRNLPATSQSKSGNGCCCVPSKGLRRKRKPRMGRRGTDCTAHPTRGVLATSLGAHFVNWVDKTDEIKQVFARFVALYINPEEAFKKLPTKPALPGPPLAPKEIPSDLPRSPQQSVEEHDFEEEVSPPHTTACSSTSGGRLHGHQAGTQVDGDLHGAVPLPPWTPPLFSASSRAMLRDGIGMVGSSLGELYARIGVGEGVESVASEAAGSSAMLRDPVPNTIDFQGTCELAGDSAATPAEKSADLMTAGCLLQYERLMWGASASGKVEAAGEEAWGDPMRPEVRQAAIALNKAIKAFAHAEHRERRENQRQRLKPGTSPGQPLDGGVGDLEPSLPPASPNPARGGE